MPEEKYFVAVDGSQLEGERDMGQVRQVCSQYAGRQVMVWNEALGSWTDPKTLPSFRVSAAPAPAPAPAPPRHPAAPRETPVAAAAAATGAAMGSVMSEDAGALKGLLDFKFENLVAPKLIRVLYIVLVVLCGLGALGGVLSGLTTMVNGLRFGMFFMIVSGIVMMVIGPVLAAFYLALMRVVFEGVHVLFQIREKLGKS
ncbi:MAG: DUF4282 domain-containing protein [Holophagales bacterium]|nr:DUF4282 domain-containing protein [Holophagales bacterium]